MSQPTTRTVIVRGGGGRKARTPLVDIDQKFLAFLFNWSTAKDAGSARDRARDAIKVWFSKGGDSDHEISVNDNGSQLVEFPEVKEVGGRKFAGIENRRTATSVLDMDLVDEYLETLPAAEREKISSQIIKPVTEYVLDPDALFKLNQEGVIPDEVMDGFYSTNVTWSLNVVPA